jgi:competence protein ComEC
MERPLVFPVLALALGILISETVQPPLWLAAILAVGAFLLRWWPGNSPSIQLTLACVAVGCWHHAVVMDQSHPWASGQVIPREPTLGWVNGVVVDTGGDRMRPGTTEAPALGRRLRLELESVRYGSGEARPVRGRIQVRFRDSAGVTPQLGQRVEVYGILSEPPPAQLPGGYDVRRYLRALGMVRQMESEDVRDWRVLEEGPGPGWLERFLPWAHGVLQRGLPDDPAARLVRAMVLGWRGGLDEDWREWFVESGTMHVFAISGLHIALVATVLVQVLRLVRLGRGACGWLAIPLTWAYVAATGWQASAIRAAVMSSVVIVGWSLRRPSDVMNSVAAAAGILLVFDPGQLFQAGFQLSFGVVTGMVVWTERISDWLAGWIRPDPLVPDGERSGWQVWMWGVLRGISVNLAGTMAAWAASLPLGIHHFHVVSLSSLGANLLVIPLSGMALMSGMGSIALGGWWAGGSELLNQSAWVWMRAMMAVSEGAARIPWGHWYQSAPTGWWWWGYGWWMLVVLPGGWKPWRKRGWRWALGLAWVLGAGIGLWQADRTTRITCLPWGAGVLVESGLGRTALFDCGSRAVAKRTLPEWLRVRGVDRLDAGVACSGESRFGGGWPGLMEAIPMEAWWSVPALRKGGALGAAQSAASGHGVPIRRLVAGRTVEGWDVLWPEAGNEERRSDAASLVLAGTVGQVRCLLIPSLNPEAQRRLLVRWGAGLRAQLVIAGMPGMGEPLIPELMEVIGPEGIVVLAGERPAMNRVPRTVRTRLKGLGVPVWFTDEVGTVTLRCRAGHWWVEVVGGTLTGDPDPGREGDAQQQSER